MTELNLPCPEPGCDEVFTGENANLAVVNHVSAAHLHAQDNAAGAVRRTPRPALLPRLAELAEQAGNDVVTWRRQLIVAEEREQAAERREALRQDERDERQARIDAALAVLDEPVPETPHGAGALWKTQNHRSVQVRRIRAALQGDQPTEPVKRCCIGPFADRSHAVNCWQRCQDCGGDETGPRKCHCRDGQPAAPLCGCTEQGHEITCPDFRSKPTEGQQ